MADQLAPSGGGLHGSFGAVEFDVSDEISRNLLESIFKRENLVTILKYGAGIATLCLVGKIAKDYWNRKKPATGTVMTYVDGKVDIDSQNGEKFMAVKESAGDGVTAMDFYGANADAKVRSVGDVRMMALGYEGEDLHNITETYQEATGKKIPIKITVEGAENEIFELKKSPTSTIREIRVDVMNKFESFLKIFRDGKELEDNLTMAQAAQTGSTVNWIAKSG